MLISNAYAAGAAPGPSEGLLSFLPILLMFGIMWFMMIRPQMKRAKEHKKLLEALSKGDEVITQGGIAGKVVSVTDHYVRVEIAEGTEVLVQKPAITTVLPKGTLKSA